MAVIIDLIQFIELAARIVHQHDVVVLQVLADKFLIEGLWRVLLCLDRIAFGVFASPGEMRWRFTQVEDQHTVDSTQHLCLTAFQIRHFFAFGGHVAQLESELFQLKSDEVAHARGVLAAVGLDHHFGRYYAIFHQQVGYACELATVTNRILE